jgi:arylsulfatase A-like enzyme
MAASATPNSKNHVLEQSAVRDKHESKLTGNRPNRRGELVLRFTLVGATIGLQVGLFEAALLFYVPRVPTLLYPDVSSVIWFLAPSLAATIFGLAGLATGWIAVRGNNRSPRRMANLAAALVGLAGAYVASVLTFLHDRPADVVSLENLTVPALWFMVVFAYGLLAIHLAWPRAAILFDLDTPWPLAIWGKGMATMAAGLILGIGVYQIGRSTRPSAVQAGPPAAGRDPNIVLITLDTVRADHLSAYGYSRPTTPHLDSFARRGVLFENAIAPSPWTLATHASLFTGLLPHQHGADWTIPLEPGPRTLAEILKSQGYETAGFTANLYYSQGSWGIGRGFEIYGDDSFTLRNNFSVTLSGLALAQPVYQHLVRYDLLSRRDARELNREVYRWFHHRSTRPFFLFINYFDAHDPYWAPPPYDKKFGPISEDAIRHMNSIDGMQAKDSLKEDDRASFIAGYDNSLAFLDDQVGRLMGVLSASPDWANTIVIITSDHGEAFGEHGTFGHGWNVYREVLHVPLIIFGPGIPAGLRIHHLARIHEIFPTVLDLALGEKLPVRRSSLRRFWTPGFQPGAFDEVAVSELIPNLHGPELKAYITLTTQEWQYLEDSKGGAELYHWTVDPEEKTNLAESPELQGVVSELRARLRRRVRLSVRPWRGSEYLFALDQTGFSFLQAVAFAREPETEPVPRELRTGFAQSVFGSGELPSTRRPSTGDEDLLRSLPYH